MKQLLLLILSLLFISGCGSLRPDYSMPTIKAGYPTAEFRCERELYHGLGVCTYVSGGIQIAVQGYFKGVIKIDSDRCDLSEKLTYTDNEEVVLNIEPSSSCVIDIVVSPSYPKESKVDVQSFKGRLYIKKLSSEDVDLIKFNSRIQEGTDRGIDIESEDPLRVAFFGCGVSFDKIILSNNGRVTVKLSDLGPLNRKDCLFEGIIGTTRTVWQAWIYDKKFTPLAKPKISRKGSKIKVEAESSVSVISFGDKYKLKNKAKFKVDNSPKVFRAITVAGRSVIGIWNGEKIEWIR